MKENYFVVNLLEAINRKENFNWVSWSTTALSLIFQVLKMKSSTKTVIVLAHHGDFHSQQMK